MIIQNQNIRSSDEKVKINLCKKIPNKKGKSKILK